MRSILLSCRRWAAVFYFKKSVFYDKEVFPYDFLPIYEVEEAMLAFKFAG